MHVTLRPSSHPELDPIEASGSLFAIGRQEPPFNTYDSQLVSKLSRRHARLFEQDGCVYLADLGSLNGTSWNGDPVKNVPVALRTGDVVEFGGLTFEAEVTVAESEPATGAATVQRLVLIPERYKETLEPIVVSSFPFLFDKTSEPFARHRQELKEVLAYMSRHHAHIFLREEELYIEDLGSTNGTFVAGRKLDERARMLKDGDSIGLGSDRLVYSVRLIRSAESGATVVTGTADASVENPTRTIFVDSPTSFLDVYFVGERSADDGGRDNAAENGSDGPAAGPPAGSRRRFVADFRAALFGGPILGPTTRRVIIGAVLAGVAAGSVWYWQGRDVRAIETAMAREDYDTAVMLAHRYLATHPDDGEIREMAARAAVLLWVPGWQSHLQEGRFDAAAAVLDGAGSSGLAEGDTAAMVDLLGWTTRTRRLLAGASADGDLNALLERARRVDVLLEWWQQDSWSHARSLDRIAAALPDFRDVREQIYSDVRQLRSEGLDYRPLIDLNRRLDEALAAGDLDRAGRIIGDFTRTHPQIPGSDAMIRDLEHLKQLDAHIAAGRWLEAQRQLEQQPFVTEPFAGHADRLRARVLPDEQTLARLDGVKRRWHEGDVDAALAGLRELSQGPWASLGFELDRRYRQLQDGYRALQAARGQPGYAARLFDYYGTLRESEDGHLLAALEPEFQNHAEAAIDRARAYLTEAEAAWSAYRRQGGIQPEHRMAERVSADFASLAGRLTQAAEALQRGERIHRQLSQALPEGIRDLKAEMTREVAFQRSQLRSLAFHEPEVQARMLGLLPEAP